MARRIGILTGGGDVPGLNMAIKGFVGRMEEAGYEVVGLRRGWAALLNVVPSASADNSEWLMPLTRANTRTIDRSGGTVLHTSRINPAIMKPDSVIPDRLRGREIGIDEAGCLDLTNVALEVLAFLRLEALVAIGGDGTLSFACRLHDEGVPLIGVPKTMDNDVFGTEYCIGFSTAVTRAVNFIHDLRTAAGSHERFLVVELFGRYSGETCLLASYLAGTDRALIAEVPFDPVRVVQLLAEDKLRNPSNYAVIAISEGAFPLGGKPVESGDADVIGNRELGGIGRLLRHELQRTTGDRVIYQRLGYLMRSGPPDALDRLVASNYANLAADLVLAGQTGRLVAITGGRYTTVPITSVRAGTKHVDVERFYDRAAYRAKIVNVLDLPMFLH
jgi:6-phosphofructokinase